MLSKVLSKETCAKCRFCCSFRRCSLWETPLFPKNECEKLSKDNEYGVKSDFQMQAITIIYMDSQSFHCLVEEHIIRRRTTFPNLKGHMRIICSVK